MLLFGLFISVILTILSIIIISSSVMMMIFLKIIFLVKILDMGLISEYKLLLYEIH